MKKCIFSLIGLFLFLSSCSNDNTTPTPTPVTPSFSLDNKQYTLIASQGISEIKFNNALTIDGVNYNRSSITIIGLRGFTETATVSFDLFYKEGFSIAGTYTIDDDTNDDLETFIAPLDRACLGWTSIGSITSFSGPEPISCNNPSGTVKIIVNSPTNYTIQYIGNYRIYNDDFDPIRNVPAKVNLRGNVVIGN